MTAGAACCEVIPFISVSHLAAGYRDPMPYNADHWRLDIHQTRIRTKSII